MRRCSARTTGGGKACKAHPVAGTNLCSCHTPNRARQIAQARWTAAAAAKPKLEEIRLKTREEISAQIERSVSEVRAGRVNPQEAYAIASLLRLAMDLVKLPSGQSAIPADSGAEEREDSAFGGLPPLPMDSAA